MSLELESKVNPLFSWNKDNLKQIFGSLKNITDESVKITLVSTTEFNTKSSTITWNSPLPLDCALIVWPE